MQKVLEHLPPARCIDIPFIFHFGPGGQFVRAGFRLAEPAFRQEAACYRSECQQLDAMLQTQLGHATPGPLIEERETDLIGHDCDTALHDDPQVGCIDIGKTQMANKPFLFELLKPVKAVQPHGIGIIPDVKLQKIQAAGLHPVEGPLHRGADVLSAYGPRLRHPFGQKLNTRTMFLQKKAGDLFCGTIMIGHIKCRKTRFHIRSHSSSRGGKIQGTAVPFHVRNLPKPRQNTGNVQIRCQFASLDCFIHRITTPVEVSRIGPPR